MKQAFLLVLACLLQGCISVSLKPMESVSRLEETSDLVTKDIDTVYVHVDYDGNYNTSSEGYVSKQKKRLLSQIGEHFTSKGMNVIDVTTLPKLPEDYLSITLIRDKSFDWRREDNGSLGVFSYIFSMFSLTLIPTVVTDTDIYVVIKEYKDNALISDNVYMDSTTQLMSVLFLPLSPFMTVNKGIDKNVNAILDSVFSMETQHENE